MENQKSKSILKKMIKINAVIITCMILLILYIYLKKYDLSTHENNILMNCTVTNDLRYGILGEKKTLLCSLKYDGYRSSVTWYHNNTKIDFSNDKKYSSYDGSLIINNLSYNDEGQYNCTATTEYNDEFTKIEYNLIIKTSQKECSMPEIKQCSSVTKKINGSVIFNCDVIDNSTIFWYHNNTKIDISSNEKYILLNNSIKINNLSIEDAGSYDCQTSDKFENKSISIYQLNIVKEAYKWISKSNYQSNLNGCGLLQKCFDDDFNEFIGRRKYGNTTSLEFINLSQNIHCTLNDQRNNISSISDPEVLEVYGDYTWESVNISSAIIPSEAVKFGTIENQTSFVGFGALDNSDSYLSKVYYDEQIKCFLLYNAVCPSTLKVLVVT